MCTFWSFTVADLFCILSYWWCLLSLELWKDNLCQPWFQSKQQGLLGSDTKCWCTLLANSFSKTLWSSDTGLLSIGVSVSSVNLPLCEWWSRKIVTVCMCVVWWLGAGLVSREISCMRWVFWCIYTVSYTAWYKQSPKCLCVCSLRNKLLVCQLCIDPILSISIHADFGIFQKTGIGQNKADPLPIIMYLSGITYSFETRVM